MTMRQWCFSRVVLGATVLLAGAALAGCGGTSKASSAAPAAPASAPAAQAGRQSRVPGAYGTAAAISGATVQVQNPATGQVSVTFTKTTRFAMTRTVTSAALKVGDCVTAVGVRAARSGSATPAPSANSSPGAPKDFTAASVSISAAVDGNCTAAGGFGGRPSGFPSRTRPSGAPSGGFGGGSGGFGGNFASGRLTALTATSMSVQVLDRRTNATSTDTVTLTSTTTYSQTAAVPSTALRVGQCVAATGPADSKGAIAATRITLSTAGPNGCSAGFGRRPGGGAPSTAPTGG